MTGQVRFGKAATAYAVAVFFYNMGKSVKMRLPREVKTGRKICIHMLQ